jgi:hypothetical protein
MRFLRWLGLILMPLAVVTGSAMYYMRYVVGSTPIWQGPTINGGSMTGGYTTDRDTAKVFGANIIICALVFGAGLVAFVIGSTRPKKKHSDGKPPPKR